MWQCCNLLNIHTCALVTCIHNKMPQSLMHVHKSCKPFPIRSQLWWFSVSFIILVTMFGSSDWGSNPPFNYCGTKEEGATSSALFLMCACVAVFKVGEFCGFPHFWSLRVQVNQVVVAFRNRLLCRILFSCGCIDKATNLFLYCNTSLLNGKCGAVNCLIPK